MTRPDAAMLVDDATELELNERLLLTLHYYEQLSLKEIAAALHLSERQARALHASGLAKVRRRMPRSPRLVRNVEEPLSALLGQQELLSKRLSRLNQKISALKLQRPASLTLREKLETLDQAELIDADLLAAQIAGGRIAAARKARGWTQQELAAEAGMPQSQVARMERNPEKCNVSTLKRVASALGVEVSALLGPGR